MGADIFPRQDRVAGAAGVADSGNNGGRAALYVAYQEHIRAAGFTDDIDHRPAVVIQRDAHSAQGIAVLLFTDGGDQAIHLHGAYVVGFHRTAATFGIRLA